ncbi:hypothetical protein [Rhodococcus sp. P1Y]|uniref:hypothetical protein n=1 Tax=Rhodococcus sp. P1Y TaxID=1302308 RepID=UPI000EB2D09B|nr:hypothetical protein [Rhodococcus sp. P1Y]AYJ51240.1 hypothetical protein D8W71_26370 [Rhodococcus sp. P1Y]
MGSTVTPFVLHCGSPPLPISLTDVPLTPASPIPTNDECDTLFSVVGTTQDPRLIVLGDDASLAAVLTRLMRTERLHFEIAFVPEAATTAGHIYRLATGSRAAKVAMTGSAGPVPLIRDDAGKAVVGRAVFNGPAGSDLEGEAYVDDTQLFSGAVSGVEVIPTAEMPGLKARVTGRRKLFGRRWVSGRAMQLGAIAANLTRDGVPGEREVKRSTFYRHDREWLLVR